jgi:hypothetical protein
VTDVTGRFKGSQGLVNRDLKFSKVQKIANFGGYQDIKYIEILFIYYYVTITTRLRVQGLLDTMTVTTNSFS